MMAAAVHNLYIDYFIGYILKNEGEGIDMNGNKEIGIASRRTENSIRTIYVLRANG